MSEESKDAVTVARIIVERIVDDLKGRRGLRQQWEQIDQDIQEEIIAKWVIIARRQIIGLLEIRVEKEGTK